MSLILNPRFVELEETAQRIRSGRILMKGFTPSKNNKNDENVNKEMEIYGKPVAAGSVVIVVEKKISSIQNQLWIYKQ